MFSIAFFLYLSKYIQDFLKILCFFSEVLEIKKTQQIWNTLYMRRNTMHLSFIVT